MKWLLAGALTGAVGDVGLQTADYFGFGNKGLEGYFEYQGRILSVLKASALTGFWSFLFGDIQIIGEPSLPKFVFFSAAVDVLYRWFYPCLYPSLEGYYEENTPVATVLYNVITAVLVFWVRGLLQ